MSTGNPMLDAALDVSVIVERATADKINDALIALRPYSFQLKVLAIRMLHIRFGHTTVYACEEFIQFARAYRWQFLAEEANHG